MVSDLPMTTHDSSDIACPLPQWTGADADSALAADAVVALIGEIDAKLTPIIGQRGMVALYHRSLSRAVDSHRWLEGLQDGTNKSIDPTALRSVIARQEPAKAFGGGTAVLLAFDQLLGTLLGLPLARRLLDSVWSQPALARPSEVSLPWKPEVGPGFSRLAR